MLTFLMRALFTKHMVNIENFNIYRHVRSIAHRGVGPKLIEGKVKTVTEYDDSEHIESYKDLVRSVKKSNLGDELEIERNFLQEDYHGDVFERCDAYYAMHESEEKHLRSRIKKKIVGRKYFKLDKETNLLTHAAKQQIRFLHESNPQEWNYKALSECFPISEEGVQKLLHSNFVLTCPEKIKAHDEEVAKRWEILKSGKFTDEISPKTQRLYKEGKLIDDYFSGNPNLPTAPPPTKKVIEISKREEKGEFSAIVQTYVNYNKQKMLESGKETTEKQVALRNTVSVNNHKSNDTIMKNIRKFKYAAEELDDDDPNPEVYPPRRKKYQENGEVSFSLFKEMLREEASIRSNSKHKSEYDDFVMKQTSQTVEKLHLTKPQNTEDCFLKISKYEKENIEVMYEKDKKLKQMYKYDETLGYQYPAGKNIKGKIHLPQTKHKKGKLYRVGKVVYDSDGEFLYRVPS